MSEPTWVEPVCVVAEVGVDAARRLQSADILLAAVDALPLLCRLLDRFPGCQVVVGLGPFGLWCVLALRDHGVLIVVRISGVVDRPAALAIGRWLYRSVLSAGPTDPGR